MKYILMLCLLLNALPSRSQTVELKLASDIWPPFTNVDKEKAMALSLVEEALNRSFASAENHIVPFSEVLKGIETGQYNGCAAMWKTEEREKTMLFSQPYLQNQLILVGTKGNDVSADELKDLNGKRIAIVGSYAYGELIDQASETTFIYGASDQENLDLLLSGEADYMLADRLLIQYLMQYQTEEVNTFLEIGRHVLVTKPLHFALSKDFPNGNELMQRFNQAIVKMSADGTYNKILRLHWISTDIDGDGTVELVMQGKNAGTDVPTNSYNVWFDKTDRNAGNQASRFYVDGKYYSSWNDVPETYKKPITTTTDGNFQLLNFTIK